MRARSLWRRAGLVLATLSLAIYTFVVAPHVHASQESPNDCPCWAAHGPAGAAVDAPEIAVAAPDYTIVTSDPTPALDAPATPGTAPFAARAPPHPIV